MSGGMIRGGFVMTDVNTVIDRYIDMWNETDSMRRRDLIAQTWTDDASYIDPLVVAEGSDAIDATVAAVQTQFPGFAFRLAGPVDAHHNLARFSWELAPNGADEAVVVGFDVAVLSDDGRLRDVHGFLDKAPMT
jgi:SnoaL-like domain